MVRFLQNPVLLGVAEMGGCYYAIGGTVAVLVGAGMLVLATLIPPFVKDKLNSVCVNNLFRKFGNVTCTMRRSLPPIPHRCILCHGLRKEPRVFRRWFCFL